MFAPFLVVRYIDSALPPGASSRRPSKRDRSMLGSYHDLSASDVGYYSDNLEHQGGQMKEY